jgi:hypothetical protein
MKTKICKICKKEKPITDFYSTYCKVCSNEKNKEYRHTLNGFLRNVYDHQRRSSKKRRHQPPAYTFKELSRWFVSQPNWEDLWLKWENSNYLKDLRPSIDRLDDSKGYSFDNIRLITWRENYMKEIEKQKVKVNQYDLEGNYIKTFESIHDADRHTNIDYRNIQAVCKGERKTADFYQWRYLSEEFPKDKNIGKIVKYKGRKINQYTLTGEYIKTWDSVAQATKCLNIKHSGIPNVCKGKGKSAAGFQWRYLSEEFPKGKNIDKTFRIGNSKTIKVRKGGDVLIFRSMKEAAEYLNCAASTIKKYMKDGVIDVDDLKQVTSLKL